MVRALGPPSRPLPKTGDKTVWWWNPPQASARWWWCRVYHQGKYTPDGVTFRQYGPAARFDHHHPADPPVIDTTGRRILYVGEDLATSACEVFGDAGIAAICPNYRVAIIAQRRNWLCRTWQQKARPWRSAHCLPSATATRPAP